MLRTLFLIVAILPFSSPASAATTGQTLLERCGALVAVLDSSDQQHTSKSERDTIWCYGYIFGFMDAHEVTITATQSERLYCLPSRLDGNQIARVVVKFLRANPEKLHLQAGVLTGVGLAQAFPCE